MMLSGYLDGTTWRWGTGEILSNDSPIWDADEPTGDPSPVVVMANVHGIHDAPENNIYDFRAICEAGKYMSTAHITFHRNTYESFAWIPGIPHKS